MPTCNRDGCTKDATKRPVITFNGEGDSNPANRARAVMGLVVCDEHADAEALKPNEAGMDVIDRSLRHNGKAKADRASVRVEFEKLP
jgi:hypothetical protein